MSDNVVFPNLFDNSASFPTPVVKANKLAVAHVEKLIEFQLSTIQYYVDLSLSRAKAAAEVSNLKEFQDFVNGQVEVAGTVGRKVVEDVKTLGELGTGFQAEWDKLTRENVESAPKTFRDASDKAAKETKKAAGAEKAA